MAGFQKIYTSQNQYLEDVARSTGLFDDEYYGIAKETGKDVEYLTLIANMKDNVSSTFDRAFYDKLSGEERFNYLATEQYMNKSSDDYKKSQEYFNQRAKQIKNEEIYSGLNGFQKAAHSVVGFLGNAFVQVGGILEGLVDSALMSMNFLAQSTGIPLIAGKASELDEKTKELIAKDTTGYNAVQAAMNDYINAYTFIDKNFVAQTVNDVAAGLVRMVPMFIPGAGQAGYVAYLASGAGNTAQGVIQENPDINYWQMFAYTAASTGLEALTEWASGKLFGGDLVSSIMKGEKYVPTGNIIKTLAKNSATEGLEEFVAELFGGILYNRMIDPSKDVRIADALYAALIGGLTGFLMTGGNVLSTKKLSLHEGKLVDPATLTPEQRKTAKKIKLGDRWSLTTLINQVRQNQNAPDNVTKLMAKYGTSLDDIKTTHNAEYQEALKQDVDTKTQQAKTILDLANVFRTIGEEQFQRATKFLEESLDEAQTLVDNYINHTSDTNKKASEAFSALYPNETFTPKAMPSNAEQQLAKSIREIVPNTAVVFGDFGSKEGLAKASINIGGNFIFIKNGLVEEMGYNKVLNDVIKYEIANDLIGQLPVKEADNIAKLALGEEVKYSKLTKDQKLAIAQMICFDQKFNQKTFFGDKETHQKLYDYINNLTERTSKFGRKTESTKLKYNNLLKVRDRFIKSVADAVANQEDLANVHKRYNMSEEEFTKKVKDATRVSILNNTIRLTDLNFAEESISRMYAMKELLAYVTEDGDFDWSRLYDKTYYKPWFVDMITQNESDFNLALRLYIAANYNTDLNGIQITAILDSIKNTMSEQDVRKAAETVLTKEFLENTNDLATIQTELANKLFYMVQLDITKANPQTDSIVVTDNQIQGTGKLKFFKGDVYEQYNIVDREQRRIASESSEKELDRLVDKPRRNPIQTQIDDLIVPVQDVWTYSTYQKELAELTKRAYGLTLEFYNGPIEKLNVGPDNKVLGFIDTDTKKLYIRDDNSVSLNTIITTIRHEVTHAIILQDKQKYRDFKNTMESLINDDIDYWFNIFKQPDYYGNYNNIAAIEEEVFVHYLAGQISVDDESTQNKIETAIQKFYEGTEFETLTNKILTESNYKKASEQGPRIRLTTQKQPSVSTQILKRFEDGSKKLSEVQYSESNSKEYLQVSYDMIDEMADTFALVNDNNYDEVRKALKNSKKPYAQQALRIFDLYTIEMVGKFNPNIAQKIENNYQKTASGAGQTLALQAQRVAERKPISDTISTLKNDGFNVTVTDEIVQLYDSKLKDKEAYIKELEQQIKDLEKQLQTAKNDIDKAALNKQLKEVSDKKGVIQSGSNADILDHILTHIDSPEQMTKLQEDMLSKLLNTAIRAQEEGKKVGYYIYDENGQPKPFPKATEKLTKTLKKLKSFRMWAMLSSPVTWVRNWLGNQGMKGLDAMTNFVEGFMTSRSDFDKNQMKFTESRAGNDLYNYIAEQNETFIMSLVRGEDVKYETTAEKAADIKRRERQIEYESANAFRKACLKAQDMADWGLSTGPLGDEPVVFRSICKNMGNLVANNINFLLQGIQAEANLLSKRTTLTEKEQARLDTLNTAITTKDAKDVFNALSKEETTRLFDVCKERSFQQYFKNPNALSKWFSKFGAKHPVYAELISWVMPFPKVAANVLSMAYRYSPLSFFKGLSEMSKYKQMQDPNYKGPSTGFEKAQMIRTFSEATVGTFMLIAGAIFSAMGLIDIDDDDYMGPCIKIGDFKVSLSDLAPSMTTFSTASAVVWAWKNDRVGVTDALNVLYDNTLLGNVENLLTYGSFTDIAKNVSISYISQYIPAILKLINKGITGGVKKDKSGNYLQRLVKTLGSYVPGVSQLVPNKIDPYTGKKVYQAGSENWFLNLLASLSPLGISWDGRSELEKQAELLGVESSGLSGRFSINDTDYTIKNKEKYAKYRAEFINNQYNTILSGKQKVTVEDDNGKRITTTYDKLNDKQKKNVINRLYTDATAMTKIKWWTDQGNKYVVTNRDQYNEYRKMFSNIIYKKTWSKSKFVES